MTGTTPTLTKKTTTVKVTCRCGKIQEKVILNTALPAESVVCHCNTCRWTTGTLFQSYLLLHSRPECVQQLSRYNSSETGTRYFCRDCGTHVCRSDHRDGLWYVASGVVDDILGGEQVSSCRLQRIADHRFVDDTKDGGLAVCLTESAENFTPIVMQGNDGKTAYSSSSGGNPVLVQDRLPAACHCGGVKFYLTRPTEESRSCSSPWPDLLRPYHSCDPVNPEDEKWWLRGPRRYLAGTCACRTCRLSNSSPITCWAFVPRVNLAKENGAAICFDLGTLHSYRIPEGRTRFFCSCCGASVFLRIDERPELIDVSFGLFRAEEGSRAESWFEWCTNRVSFAEAAFDPCFVDLCEAGLSRLAQTEQ